MSTHDYVIWFVLQTGALVVILVVGTLGASGHFSREARRDRAARRRQWRRNWSRRRSRSRRSQGEQRNQRRHVARA